MHTTEGHDAAVNVDARTKEDKVEPNTFRKCKGQPCARGENYSLLVCQNTLPLAQAVAHVRETECCFWE